jgi:sugar/nucleoside kinase (ribokinase family)
MSLDISLERPEICRSAARKIAAGEAKLRTRKLLLMPDGFVDSIISVVDKRQNPKKFQPIASIDSFGKRVVAAAGQSANFEMWVNLQKLGGNGPIMANALAGMGIGKNVTYIGMVGYPKIHRVFEPLAEKANVIGIVDPGLTDAWEFEDGKLMMGKYGAVNDLNWVNLVDRVGRAKLQKLVEQADLIGMVNWTMLPYLTELWAAMHKEMLRGGRFRDKIFFADLCDPAKRDPKDLLRAMKVLSAMREDVQVTLGLNLSEAMQVAAVLGLDGYADPEQDIEEMARDIRAALKIACVVIHPRASCAAATEDDSAWIEGPFVQKPKLSTGAGDNFNAGFCLGQLLGLSLAECLAAAKGSSGFYVRKARSATLPELARFINKLPMPELS